MRIKNVYFSWLVISVSFVLITLAFLFERWQRPNDFWTPEFIMEENISTYDSGKMQSFCEKYPSQCTIRRKKDRSNEEAPSNERGRVGQYELLWRKPKRDITRI